MALRTGRRTLAALLSLATVVGSACSGTPTGGSKAEESSQGPTSSPPPSPTASGSAPRALQQHVVAKIEVGAAPETAAIAYGSVWVANHRGDSISRIDPETNEVSTIELPGGPVGNILQFGAGSVWVEQFLESKGRDVIRRVDSRTNEVVDTIPVSPRLVRSVFAEGYLWSYDGSNLIQIDPEVGEVIDRVRISQYGSETYPNYVRGSLWVATAQHGLLRVDPETKEVIATVDVTAYKVVTDGHDIWTVDEGEGTMSMIDPKRNQVVATVEVGPATQGGILARVVDGMIWVRVSHDRLLLVDGEKAEVTRTFDLPPGEGPSYVDAGFGSLWVPLFSANEVWRVEL